VLEAPSATAAGDELGLEGIHVQSHGPAQEWI